METKVTKKGKEVDLFFNYYKPTSFPQNILLFLIKQEVLTESKITNKQYIY